MGYDVEFIVMNPPAGTSFPVDSKVVHKLLAANAQTLDAKLVGNALLGIPGSKAGPGGAVDYLGAGLGYARLTVKPKAIHVENNCGPKDLLKIQAALTAKLGAVFIHDLQSGQLHDADSFTKWWSKPL
jgi:hypothetical protein